MIGLVDRLVRMVRLRRRGDNITIEHYTGDDEFIALLAFRRDGTVYQIEHGELHNATIDRIRNPRKSVAELLDRLGVMDYPAVEREGAKGCYQEDGERLDQHP